jgi:Protein of unknown function (DUF2612)
MRTDDYVALVTSEHRGAILFQAVVRAMTQGLADGTDALKALLGLYDLDFAIGDQLDTIGLWVGITRRVPVPITDVYFTWDGTVATGWGQGQWKGPFDPGTGIVELGDSDFRLMIRAKIAANMWDGSAQQLSEILVNLFGTAGNVTFIDNQNGTYRINYDTQELSAVQQALLINDFLLLRPAGISVTYQPF